MSGAVDRATVLAFVGIVVLGGVNGTAIKIANLELGPFWSATLRFGLASLIFFVIVAVRRVPLPRGRRLAGSILYGLLAFGVTFALVNWGLVAVPVGLAQILLALVPLLTLLLAIALRMERFRVQSFGGSLLALGGVGLVFVERIGGDAPLPHLLALFLAATLVAMASLIVKRLPRVEPVANNAVAMGVGALVLLGLSVVLGDRLSVPQSASTWLALGYLVLAGSVIVFSLYLFVIVRWTASATSYAMLLMPLVAVVVASAALGERITIAMLIGGALVLGGVYLGAFAPTLARPLPGLFRRARKVAGATAGPQALSSPNCP